MPLEFCNFPAYESSKLLGVDKHICMITLLGDPCVVFLDNGFSDVDERKALWLRQRRKKLPNPFSCTALSFMERSIKENAYNCDDHSHIYCYTSQLSDRAEEANMHNRKPFCSFYSSRQRIFWYRFCFTDLVHSDPERKLVTRKAVRSIAKMMCYENESRIIQNFPLTENTLFLVRSLTIF